MITVTRDQEQLAVATRLARQRLLSERCPDGIWRGELSSSAVSTAVAAFALAKISPHDQETIRLARKWLAQHINADGGWGDTPQSPSNISATLLSHAALFVDEQPTEPVTQALKRSEQWLVQSLGGITPKHIISGIQQVYGKDLTFAVPILMVCALSGLFGSGQQAWADIPRLPFELSVLPHQLYHWLKFPVVSYALPALIAVGIAQFQHAPTRNIFMHHIRKASIHPALDKLEGMTPQHGGFLEAAPLTGFVAVCLGCAGFEQHPVVQKALGFLRATVRSNGAWPIDTDLSQWITTLAAKALADQDSFNVLQRRQLADRLRQQQFCQTHPFTQARPGGWGWTFLAGGVPDADDTAGALLALAVLEPGNVTPEICSGIQWLLEVMNRDGGVPTFCKGWGLLPFDRSCPDISAHTLEAFARWYPHVPQDLQKRMKKGIRRIIRYLEQSRDADLVWSPLWFGDQHAPRQTNRVYGTATVLLALSALPYEQVRHLVQPACSWLLKARNPDGGWGGEPQTPSHFETSAQALAALALFPVTLEYWDASVDFLVQGFIQHDGLPPSAPIGFYFASLWYDEKLYPLLFGLRALNNIHNRQAGNTRHEN
jgi:squalene-hopene/tetraprenyl-beta-curcumene cyclase